MARSAGDDECRAQAARFAAEVERKAKTILQTNRKLAKDVTRWVDASMALNAEAGSKGGEGGEDGEEVTEVTRDAGVEETKGGEGSGVGMGAGGASWLGSWFR